MRHHPLLRAAGGIALAAGAAAGQEPLVFSPVPSNGILNSPANTVHNRVLNGGYALGRIRATGTLTSLHQYTWRTDSRILITAPGGDTFVFQPFTSGSTYTTLPFDVSFFFRTGTNPAGTWSFRFFETLDDGGVGAVDATWSATLTFTDEPPVAPAATNLGTLAAPGTNQLGVALAAGGVRWYRFALNEPVRANLNSYLDIDTFGSLLPAVNAGEFPDDTVLALYDAAGVLVATDDDSGDGFTSQLTFGVGTRPPQGTSVPYDGRHGPLAAGTYYLAACAYPAQVGPNAWGIVPGGAQAGTLNVRLFTNVGDACYPDCNADAALTVADFGCFQTKFVIGHPYADCTGDGNLSVADFGCFQTKFVVGCP